MSKLLSISLYYVSFLPLWISILFIDVLSLLKKESCVKTELISMCCILIAMCVSITVIYRAFHRRGKEGSTKHTIKTAKEEKTISAEYLLSYILPLFAFDFTLWEQVVLFLIFFTTLGYLCVKHNHHSINILLEIAGFRFYECDLKNNDEVVTNRLIMSKQRLNELKGMDIYIAALNNDYSLDVGAKK